ncbi:uncharacterized protein PGTG_01618 [Puccinia graminis f. sp. tritici CRL 75-36-700-3]|uniref:Uncharacterized protein n=1 Tax=Puccinia graminis f. sp. tritici (strain CRL 75-36-700-3 / race SCCL) TaxID=418459 RepID=E3JSA4_PUCGT|nr:uncharacterized protein PGTG_01618 [Puccinia graminis f. sp. tritici CRL 75-36-700-3]EFP75025.2 hypothetical protein PGTG_01618 [Puccinia graminis f. sp. tritici CRL 75-36-700-3]
MSPILHLVILFVFFVSITLSRSHPQGSQPRTTSPLPVAPSTPRPATVRGSTPSRTTGTTKTQASHGAIRGTGLIPPQGDHPEWSYRNGEYIRDQQDHFRFHCYLAMSPYGDYSHKCPIAFPGGFQVLQHFSGGYIARVEEMEKVVIVFKGFATYQDVDLTPASVSSFVSDCADCMVAAGVRNQYLRLKAETNDFAVAKNAVVTSTNNGGKQMLFSVTGLGWGGALAALCALELGSQNWVHYSHNSGTPRFMNDAAVLRYDNLFQFLAGQSVVSNNDYAVQYVPKGVYSHIGQKVRIHGEKSQWYVNCFGNNENSTCLGDGSSSADHTFYFTPIGQCGSADKGF